MDPEPIGLNPGQSERLGRWLLISDAVGALAVAAIGIALLVASLS